MIVVILEFVLSFFILSLWLSNLINNNYIINNLVNTEINSSYKNFYYSYIYNIYNDCFDNKQFEDFLDISGKNCNIDNNGNGYNENDAIDGCIINFLKSNNTFYKYKGHLFSSSNYKKAATTNELISNTFLTVKKTDDKYIFNVFTLHNPYDNLGSFIIEKNK